MSSSSGTAVKSTRELARAWLSRFLAEQDRKRSEVTTALRACRQHRLPWPRRRLRHGGRTVAR